MNTRRKDSRERRDLAVLLNREGQLVHDRVVHPSLAADEVEVVDVWNSAPAVQRVVHGIVASVERLGHDACQAVDSVGIGGGDLAHRRRFDSHGVASVPR